MQRGHKYRGPGLVLAGLFWAACAAAQGDPSTPRPVPLAECLQPPAATRGLPVYPAVPLSRREGAQVDVDLVFTAPDAPPKVVPLSEPPFAFLRSVQQHVAAYRLPCLPRGAEPLRLRQIFEFVPTAAQSALVQASRLRQAEPDAEASKCLTRIEPGDRPRYPRRSLEDGKSGKLYTQMTFEQPDAPPQVSVLASNGDSAMAVEVQRFLAGFRLPCLPPGASQQMTTLFVFNLQGDRRTVLTERTALTQWLGAVRDLRRPVAFDLDAMGCPFDLALQYYRPHRPNEVAEIGPSRPERRLFMDWLSETTLKLDPARNTTVLGESTTVQVPCGRITLDADPPAPTPPDPSPKPQE
jgi:hypothetical protein